MRGGRSCVDETKALVAISKRARVGPRTLEVSIDWKKVRAMKVAKTRGEGGMIKDDSDKRLSKMKKRR